MTSHYSRYLQTN